MAAPLEIIVIGGSLGGLFAANLLLRAGFDAKVYERVPEELAGRGAGIVTHQELHDALRACGIAIDDSLGNMIAGRRAVRPDGSLIADHPLPQLVTSWGRLHHVLRNALPRERYEGGREAVEIDTSDERVRVKFADGKAAEADLVLGADGVRS